MCCGIVEVEHADFGNGGVRGSCLDGEFLAEVRGVLAH